MASDILLKAITTFRSFPRSFNNAFRTSSKIVKKTKAAKKVRVKKRTTVSSITTTFTFILKIFFSLNKTVTKLKILWIFT